MWTLLSIALRNVLRNRRRTLLTLLAITLGVGAAVLIRGMLNGLQRSILTATVEGQTGALQVHRKGYLANVLSAPLSLDFEVGPDFLAKVRAVPGVKEVAARLQFAGSLTVTPADGSEAPEAIFFSATAVDPVAEARVCPQRARMFAEGSTLDDEHLLLGEALAKSLGAKPGDEAVLLAPDRDGALSGELSHVGGQLKTLMPGEPKVALAPLSLAQRLLHMDGRATELAVSVHELERAGEVAARLQEALGADYEVHTWESVATERKVGMDRQNVVAGIISFIFLLLMLLGVANTMLMSVLERTREIGTMMSVGVKRGSVLVLFLSEALFIGLLGGCSGVTVGAAITAWLGQRGLKVTPPSASVTLELFPYLTLRFTGIVLGLALLGAALFALYPAFRASRLRPVDALAGR